MKKNIDLKVINKDAPKVVSDMVCEYTGDEDFLKMLEESPTLGKGVGSIIVGTVTEIGSKNVIFDIGMKNEGRALVDEFMISGEYDELAVGKTVELLIEVMEDFSGCAVLSREKALKHKMWPAFLELKEKREVVEGYVCGKIKGGLVVNLDGVLAFLPGSQVDVRPIWDTSRLFGVRQPFHIISMEKQTRNVIVSRKSVFEGTRLSTQEKVLESIEEGQIFEGRVKNITKYGAFIDLGDIDGLLHLTDMSWKRVSHPSELLSIGQKVRVMVVKVNKPARRVSLGMKQLHTSPWHEVSKRYKPGDKVKGRVTNVADYGVFVELESGIEGLVYVSEISWMKFTDHPSTSFKKGQEISVMILGVDEERNRISLGIKQCLENPWVKFSEEHKINDIVTGVVNNIMDFGIFVTLAGKMDGLVHVSDIAWKVSLQNALSLYTRGQEVRVKILNIDVMKGRVGLGIKQIERDPYEEFLKNVEKGASICCTITDMSADGSSFFVAPKDQAETTFSVNSEAVGLNKESLRLNYRVGSVLFFVVQKVDPSKRSIELSVEDDGLSRSGH